MKCQNNAKYRFTWPGTEESFICDECVIKLKNVAHAIGLPLQIIELSENDLQNKITCKQEKR